MEANVDMVCKFSRKAVRFLIIGTWLQLFLPPCGTPGIFKPHAFFLIGKVANHLRRWTKTNCHVTVNSSVVCEFYHVYQTNIKRMRLWLFKCKVCSKGDILTIHLSKTIHVRAFIKIPLLLSLRNIVLINFV